MVPNLVQGLYSWSLLPIQISSEETQNKHLDFLHLVQ